MENTAASAVRQPLPDDGPRTSGASLASGGTLAVRRVEPRDVDAVVALWEDVFPEYADPAKPQRAPRANIERKLAWGDGLFWLAEERGGQDAGHGEDGRACEAARPLGTIMAGYDGHRGWIYSLGVRPQARRTGVATALVEQAEAELDRLGCPKVNIQVYAGNEAGLAFWRARGYQEDEVASLGRRLG